MIESIEFTNFKALRKTTLPLAPFTLLLGPNGAGKSSVLQALQGIAAYCAQQLGLPSQGALAWPSLLSVTAEDRNDSVEVKLRFRINQQLVIGTFQWTRGRAEPTEQFRYENGKVVDQPAAMQPLRRWLCQMQTYLLDPFAIAQPCPVGQRPLNQNGSGLAAVLDDLRDNCPDRWNSLLAEMCQWLPEYDYIMFDKPQQGTKGFNLRTKTGGHLILARDLSQGTLVSLALLTLAYLPDAPTLVGLEEIDRGLHPRLLRHMQDALYRLAYPQSCGETRPPIQVIATTHSPYLLDLYRDYPEEVVLAEKKGLEVSMKRLSEIEHVEEILGDSPLSEVWYSGVLGGVSVSSDQKKPERPEKPEKGDATRIELESRPFSSSSSSSFLLPICVCSAAVEVTTGATPAREHLSKGSAKPESGTEPNGRSVALAQQARIV